MTQEFLLWACSNDLFEKADPDVGKLRAWLFSSLKLFLGNRHRTVQAAKRGGKHKTIAFDSEDFKAEAVNIAELAATPDEAFDRAWLAAILHNAVESLRLQYRDIGREESFATLLPWIALDADADSQLAAAQRLEISVSTFRVQLHRLRRRFADEIRTQVAQTLGDDQNVEEELNQLFEIAKRK
jgi:hypothetical protein